MRSAIDLQAVEFSWKGQRRLLDVERFTVERGERVFVKGPSGSGKSTLLGLVGGVLTPLSGTVSLLGTKLNDLDASGRDRFRGEHLGFIFQMFNLIPYLTVRENVLLPLQFSAARKKRLADTAPTVEALRLLTALGLSKQDLLERPVTDLSIGQQQRVAAARALIGRPEIVVADEPTSALDADTRAGFLKLLMNECRAHEITLLFVSHDASLRGQFDRSFAMSDVNRASAQVG
jgi:putative ABC transport system ATP-binding protein